MKQDDGMIHDYQTCPKCKAIVADEDIVRVDGRKMCRQCLRDMQRQRPRL